MAYAGLNWGAVTTDTTTDEAPVLREPSSVPAETSPSQQEMLPSQQEMLPAQQETPWLTPAEMRAWRGYMDGNQRLMEVLNRELQDSHDLSLADYRILVMLSEAPDGSTRMSDLADGVLSSRSRLTHQIRRMESQGIVERTTCAEDGRGVLAQITDEGRRRLAAAAPTHVAGVRKNLVDLLTPNELEVLADVFSKVDAAIGDR
ncbi:UNVERIFIED_ORG: MarR family transcriptional regulator [Nocardia globerula]|uniref:MarR family transcriptional regulator n=2 Tax=Nocardiaceae TaxID=85025 RepID=A0A652YQ19_NOCGL|nr:homoprotocatechuate degradation operon regulator, HpaR [Rhodococcus sp. AD45]PVX68268.1 MarR family transcriptional regulator [Rhodococcus globerulus]